MTSDPEALRRIVAEGRKLHDRAHDNSFAMADDWLRWQSWREEYAGELLSALESRASPPQDVAELVDELRNRARLALVNRNALDYRAADLLESLAARLAAADEVIHDFRIGNTPAIEHINASEARHAARASRAGTGERT